MARRYRNLALKKKKIRKKDTLSITLFHAVLGTLWDIRLSPGRPTNRAKCRYRVSADILNLPSFSQKKKNNPNPNSM